MSPTRGEMVTGEIQEGRDPARLARGGLLIVTKNVTDLQEIGGTDQRSVDASVHLEDVTIGQAVQCLDGQGARRVEKGALVHPMKRISSERPLESSACLVQMNSKITGHEIGQKTTTHSILVREDILLGMLNGRETLVVVVITSKSKYIEQTNGRSSVC